MKRILLAMMLVIGIASTASAQRCNNGQCSLFNQQQAQQQALPPAQPALNFQLPEKVPQQQALPMDEAPKEQRGKKTSVDEDADLEDAQLVRRTKARKITLDVAAMNEIARPRGVQMSHYGGAQLASAKLPASMFKQRR